MFNSPAPSSAQQTFIDSRKDCTWQDADTPGSLYIYDSNEYRLIRTKMDRSGQVLEKVYFAAEPVFDQQASETSNELRRLFNL